MLFSVDSEVDQGGKFASVQIATDWECLYTGSLYDLILFLPNELLGLGMCIL